MKPNSIRAHRVWHDAIWELLYSYTQQSNLFEMIYLGIDKNRSNFLCVTKNLVDFVRISILIKAQISNGIKRANIWYTFNHFFVLCSFNCCWYCQEMTLRHSSLISFQFFFFILVFSLKSQSFCSALVALSRFHLPARENLSVFFLRKSCVWINKFIPKLHHVHVSISNLKLT